MSKIDVICDHSQQNLEVVPMRVLEMCNLQMLYLEGNSLELLPGDLFQKLPKLSWLDLRNNKLHGVPVGIANHACLENLLLEHNFIEKLPNELGLVPKLVVLQLAKNPLIYPKKNIITKGTNAICFFLRNEYNKEHGIPIEETTEEFCPAGESKPIKKQKQKRREKVSVRELLRRASHNSRLQMEHMPTISIRSLSSGARHPGNSDESIKSTVCVQSPRKPQKVTRYCYKLSVPTHYNSNKYIGVRKSRPNDERILDQELKEIWTGKLKELLTSQEKCLQQERNLQALSSWRLMKKLEPPREAPANMKTEVPYDTSPEHQRMLSRKDLTTDIGRMLKRRKCVPKKKCDMQKLINELVSQIKVLEATSETDQSQTNEMEKSEKEIQRIISIHKKVIELQQKNENAW